jgi:hypothetical protein
VDIIDSPVREYCSTAPEASFLQMSSMSDSFRQFIASKHFDLVFIDGDHSYNAVKNDYEISKNSGRIFVFHDIVNDVCPGVVQFWNELKQREAGNYDFYEFVEQYDDVWNDTHQRFLGIGVAIKK